MNFKRGADEEMKEKIVLTPNEAVHGWYIEL